MSSVRRPSSHTVSNRLMASSHRHARHDKTVLSVSRPLRRSEMDSRDNSRLSPTENLKSEHVQSNCSVHIATPDTTQTGPSCCVWRAWRCELGITVQSNCFLCPGKSRHITFRPREIPVHSSRFPSFPYPPRTISH